MIKKSKGYNFYNPNKEKRVISRDVKFDEEEAWDWKVDDGEKYDFLQVLDEEGRYKDHQEPIVTPLQSLNNSISPLSSSFSNGSSSNGNPPSPPRKMSSLDDFYEVTTSIDHDVTLYYHLAICDPIMFYKGWKVENCYEWGDYIIENNASWKLVPGPKWTKLICFKWIYIGKKKECRKRSWEVQGKVGGKGYSQKHKIEYEEVFALVTRLEIIQLIIVIAAQHRCQISFCKLLS